MFIDAPWTGERPQADALVTTTRGLAISVLTADCTPVLLADVDAGVIGAAHAGWKGALGGVLESAVALMRSNGRNCASSPRSGRAFIKRRTRSGRSSRPRSWRETLASRATSFLAKAIGVCSICPAFCADRLKQAGVAEIETLPLDTYTQESRLFSHRRCVHRKEPGDYGRNCAAIAL